MPRDPWWDRSHLDRSRCRSFDPASSAKTRRRLALALSQWTLTWSTELLSTFQRKCDSLVMRTITRRNMRRQDNRFTRPFIAYSEISELSSSWASYSRRTFSWKIERTPSVGPQGRARRLVGLVPDPVEGRR